MGCVRTSFRKESAAAPSSLTNKRKDLITRVILKWLWSKGIIQAFFVRPKKPKYLSLPASKLSFALSEALICSTCESLRAGVLLTWIEGLKIRIRRERGLLVDMNNNNIRQIWQFPVCFSLTLLKGTPIEPNCECAPFSHLQTPSLGQNSFLHGVAQFCLPGTQQPAELSPCLLALHSPGNRRLKTPRIRWKTIL